MGQVEIRLQNRPTRIIICVMVISTSCEHCFVTSCDGCHTLPLEMLQDSDKAERQECVSVCKVNNNAVCECVCRKDANLTDSVSGQNICQILFNCPE